MDKLSIADNLDWISDRIYAAADSAGREPDQIRLVVVTKGQPLEIVQQAIEAGVRDIGENYVEESVAKIETVNEEHKLKWHMIGHVQSRKARKVAEYFDWVQSIDSRRLANRLDRFAGELGKKIPVLLECNVSGEEAKFGFTAWNELEWTEFAEEVAPILELKNLKVKGLMTMPPFFPDPNQARPFFIRLRKLSDYLSSQFPNSDWHELSMGMSADFEVAVQEGATMVRIGTAIFGSRI